MQTSRKAQKNETPTPMPPNGSAISWTISQPSASASTITATTIRTPTIRRGMPALAGGAMIDIARSANSWRLVGGVWPSFSVAVLRSPARRSASASEASAMRRSCSRSCGRAAAIATRKCSRERFGVHALGGARAEDRLGRGLVLRLGLELLVGARLEPLHGGEGGLLLDLDLSRLGHGSDQSRRAAGTRSARGRAAAGRAAARSRGTPPSRSRTARCRSARRHGTAMRGTGSGRARRPAPTARRRS